MKKPISSRLFALLIIISLATACRGARETPTPTLLDPGAVLTAAANTAQVRMTELVAGQPSATPATPTAQLTTTTVSATVAVTPTLNLTASPPAAGGTDKAEFVTDVTVPDGTVFKPGESFVKTWRLKNTGTATWTPAYSVVFVSGNQMGGAPSTPLPNNVPPGQTVDISVNMVAPKDSGNYFSFWMLRNPSQNNFGVGPGSDQPFYVLINVQGSGGGGTPAPTVSGGNMITDVGLAVDDASVEGDCPHTFNFIAKFTLTRPATVSYRLEAETGFPLTLPAPFNGALDAGTYTLSYALEFTDSVDGTARFHVTAPENVLSNQVAFTLDCP
jgi:hypothetical protein